ncbi:MAG: RibD family protein, partial [Lutibacter sp.]
RFFTYHNKKRPFIFLKWAETPDGFIDELRDSTSEKSPNWISNTYSQQLVHKMRAEEQAILVGTNTALNDNPKLNARNWFGLDPVRIVLDKSLKIPSHYHLMDGSVKTIVITEKTPDKSVNVNTYFEQINFSNNLAEQICAILYHHEIQSVIIEGGAQTLQTFIAENLWDEAFVFVGNTKFENGLKAPELKKAPNEIRKISEDALKIYVNI